MRRLTLLFAYLLMIGVSAMNAQSASITGTVMSGEDGMPVIGASVQVKGTTQGTVTDYDGNFTIAADANAMLVVSYIGLQTAEVLASNGMVITLKSNSEELDELVVVALGISKEKKALGYAVEDIDSDDLTRGASTSVSTAIQGKVSGVEITPSSGMPGASAKIQIRGARSFTGNNSPLYVVDGMPINSNSDISTGNSVTGADYANRSLDIDPNDIESINILKGQAASALYGMRASNGVIVITTKSGKGADKGKPQITFNTNLSFDLVSTTPDYQMDYAQGMGGVFNPNGSTAWGPKISELANDATYGGNTDNAYTQKYGKKEGMYYVPQRADAGLDPWAKPQAYDNIKDFFNTGVTWANSVNVAQAFDKGNYSFSLGNTTQDGIVPGTGYDRYNVKLGASAKLHKNWETGFNGNFIHSKLNKQTGGNDAIMATVYGAPASYDLAGIPNHVEGDPYTQLLFRPTVFNNPYWATEHNEFSEQTNRFFGNAYLQYTTRFNTDNHKMIVKYQLGTDAYTTNYTESWGYGTRQQNSTGQIAHTAYTSTELNSLATIAYQWYINDDFSFDALIGNEVITKETESQVASGMKYNFAGWNHISNATVKDASQAYRTTFSMGNFASASLSYANMLYLSATVRNDIVSYMPRNNRSFTYPSVSLGWIFTELDALDNDVLTYGKIRASYAEVGMADDYYQSYYTTPEYGGGMHGSTPILYPMGGVTSFTPYPIVYDPNLKPQNTKSYEAGIDLSFWHDRLSVNYTFSRQNVKDQIFAVPLAGSTGSSSLITNGGAIHTNVHELSINATAIDKKNFTWNIGANFSKVDNYVDELAPGVESIFLGGFVDPQVRAQVGSKFPVIYGVTYQRNDEGKIIVDENGLPMAGAEGVIGDVAPDFTLGFNTSFQIYKLNISAVFDWKYGGQMYSGTKNTMDYYGTSQQSADLRNYVDQNGGFVIPNTVKQNADGTYSENDIEIKNAFSYYNRVVDISEAGVYDAGFLKLRELALSYPIVEKKYLNVNLNLFARNIILFNELGGLDPESSQGNNNMGGGFERFSLPGAASYGFGLNFKF